MGQKRLYKSDTNKIFGGVMGGIGEYFDVDPVLIRVFWVAFLILSGIIPGLIVYVIIFFIIPKRRPGSPHYDAS